MHAASTEEPRDLSNRYFHAVDSSDYSLYILHMELQSIRRIKGKWVT